MNNIINDASVNEWFSQQMASLTPMKMVLALAMGFIVGLIIALVYRKAFRGVLYSPSFATTLIMLCMITTPVVMCIKSNIALSMGMVGALSIVRFRTAIKDPMDLMFLFWSISVGIICGAGLAQVAVILSIVVTLGVLILDQMPVARAPMILVVNATDLDAEKIVVHTVVEYDKHFHVKSRNMTSSSLDMVIELRTAQGGELVRKVMGLEGVTSAALLSHDGEVTF